MEAPWPGSFASNTVTFAGTTYDIQALGDDEFTVLVKGVPVGRIGFPLALTEMAPLLQLVGPAVAAELLLANRMLDAREAYAKGLLQQVLMPEQFEPGLAALVRGVLAGSPLAARQNKDQIRQLMANHMRYTQQELDASFAFFGSADYKEGIAAFLAKRAPRFTGR